MANNRFGPWKETKAALEILPALSWKTAQKLAEMEANQIKKKIEQAFDTEGRSNDKPWPPLEEWTWKEKGHKNILSDTKKLRNSIQVVKTSKGWSIEVNPTAAYEDGTLVSRVGWVHENGMTIAVVLTKQMAAYLALRAKQLGIKETKGHYNVGDVMLIKIPKRSFLVDTYEAHFRSPLKRIAGMGVIAGLVTNIGQKLNIFKVINKMKSII